MSIIKRFCTICILISLILLSNCDSKKKSEPEFFTISGVILAESGSRVDSDVNSYQGEPPVDNNDFILAQELDPLPISVAGYINTPGQGPQGNSYSEGT